MNEKLLAIYLNDHLAGSTTGVELAKRARGSNKGNQFGSFLAELMQEIDEDRAALVDIMERLDFGQDRVKLAFGWAGEKVGRLKLNGSITGYSPLSRLVELEGLSLGVEGKLALWQALTETIADDPRLDGVDLNELEARAKSQRERLERHRQAAARVAFRGESMRAALAETTGEGRATG